MLFGLCEGMLTFQGMPVRLCECVLLFSGPMRSLDCKRGLFPHTEPVIQTGSHHSLMLLLHICVAKLCEPMASIMA